MGNTYVSLDIEMTGPRPEQQEIIELAAIKFNDRRVLDSWATLVNPKVPIPYSVRILTGISQEEVNRAPTLSEVVQRLVSFVGNHPIVGQSIPLDMQCLERNGVKLVNPLIDTFELASILLPQLEEYGLAALVRHFEIPFPRQHRAADDALATKHLFLALQERALTLDLRTIQEINRLAKGTNWPLRHFFEDVEREKGRNVFTGSSIREQLLAKVENNDLPLFERQESRALTPASRPQSVDVATLARAMEADGTVAEKLPGYEHRPEQIAMLQAVGKAFNEGGKLIVEAGTGVGKSLAYLLPAIHFATANSQRVVVSTSTINLQDQLYLKDLPSLQTALEATFKVALVKGRTNYLCLLRWRMARYQPSLKAEDVSALAKIIVWLPTTHTGDVAELNMTEVQRAIWGQLSCPAESCLGNQCEFFRKNACYVFRARREAESAHIVVVNHSLLLSDMLTQNRLLPEYRYLVIDEAHRLEDEATEQLTFSVGQRDLSRYLNALSLPMGPSAQGRRGGLVGVVRAMLAGGKLPKALASDVETLVEQLDGEVDRARTASDSFFVGLGSFLEGRAASERGYDPRVRLTPSVRAQPGWADVEIAQERLSLNLGTVGATTSKLHLVFSQSENGERETLMVELAASNNFNREVRENLNAMICSPHPDHVYWVAVAAQSGERTLRSAPIRVGDILKEDLFSDKESVVLTSATLATARSFGYVEGQLGLDDADELLLGSPFDYSKSTLLYIPDDIPEPDKPQYQQLVQKAVFDLCQATGGRALCLFTSHSQLRQTWQGIRQPLEQQGILAVAHGVDGSPRQLLRQFRSNPKTVLLGTASFWEGVDVVGDALSVLVIARLPFAVPTDPIVAARSENFDDPFKEYSIPNAILRFRQGFGRLIRSKKDRGVVVILDRRVISKAYGPDFIRSLPQCTVRQGPLQALPREAVAWLNKPRTEAGRQAPEDRSQQAEAGT